MNCWESTISLWHYLCSEGFFIRNWRAKLSSSRREFELRSSKKGRRKQNHLLLITALFWFSWRSLWTNAFVYEHANGRKRLAPYVKAENHPHLRMLDINSYNNGIITGWYGHLPYEWTLVHWFCSTRLHVQNGCILKQFHPTDVTRTSMAGEAGLTCFRRRSRLQERIEIDLVAFCQYSMTFKLRHWHHSGTLNARQTQWILL